jgi:RNA-splicing ligase RtcB
MWAQIMNAASYEGVTGAYLMPDAHSGFGVPVGCVVVTDDTIIQAGSGYDTIPISQSSSSARAVQLP